MKRISRRRSSLRSRGLRALVLLSVVSACGSRTGLFGDDDELASAPLDGGPSVRDGAVDAPPIVDASPPDVIPPIDARPPRDASRPGCADASATLVYLISDKKQLLSYDPGSGAMKTIGVIECPTSRTSSTPFSMAVDQKGIAYVVYQDGPFGIGASDTGKLFRVSTATAACVGTSFLPNQEGFGAFGMGFAADDVGTSDTLYVMGSDLKTNNFAKIGIPDFKLTKIAGPTPPTGNAEMTGTGDGRLFAFYNKDRPREEPPAYIGELDKNTGRVVGEQRLDEVSLAGSFAFAAWGGDFYMFTAGRGATQSDVTRFRPLDRSVKVVATVPAVIVGAGVSTCAPLE